MAGSIGKAFKAMFGGGQDAPTTRKAKAGKKKTGIKTAKPAKGAAASPRTRKKTAKPGARGAPPAPIAADSLAGDVENVELALAIARAEAVLDEPKRLPAADTPLKADLTRALEQEAARGGDAGAKAAALLDQIDGGAGAPAPAMARTPAVPDADAPADREALIAQALSIHRQKSKMISRLPREARERLVIMAQHAFGGVGRGPR